MIYQAYSTITAPATPAETTDNHIDELRKIAILIYEIMIIQIYQLLWTTYLKSGMGQLIIQSQKQPIIYPTKLSIWPKELKLMLSSRKIVKNNDTEVCFNFVNDYLHELNHELKKYQIELNIKENTFDGYTLVIQKMIERYIEQYLSSFRLKIEHQIELIHYDYHIQALKLEYFRHNPNSSQKQLMKELCQSKYEQELTEQEYHLLKQQITYYNSPDQSFECSPIAQSPLIDSIDDANIRLQFFNQYKDVAEQSRTNLFTLYMKSAVDQREEYKIKHDNNLMKMMKVQQSSVDNEQTSMIMIDLIKQRYNKISERIKCIYKFKAQSIHSTSKS